MSEKFTKAKQLFRFEANVSTTTVEFGAVSDRQTAIVGDESERNVDSSSIRITYAAVLFI